jgi:antitoxin PrlF
MQPMSYKLDATVTSKGQVTVPVEIRERLGVKPGDRLRFHLSDSGRLTVTAIHRRSIFDRLDELKLPPLGRRLTRADIDSAVDEAMRAQEERIRGNRGR